MCQDLRFLALLPMNEYCLRDAANLIESLIPKPISEAPIETDCLLFGGNFSKDGMVLGCVNHGILASKSSTGVWILGVDFPRYTFTENPTHFIHLSSIQKLMEGGE